MAKYEAKSNFLEKFLEDFVIEELNSHITKADFFKKFNSWCKENRHREMSEQSLGKKMKEIGIDTTKKYFDWLHDGNGGQLRCWMGSKWKD